MGMGDESIVGGRGVGGRCGVSHRVPGGRRPWDCAEGPAQFHQRLQGRCGVQGSVIGAIVARRSQLGAFRGGSRLRTVEADIEGHGGSYGVTGALRLSFDCGADTDSPRSIPGRG